MYEYIFQTKIATLLTAVLVASMGSALTGNFRLTLRSIAYNFGPSFACAFYLVGIFFEGEVSYFDLIAGFLFEFSVLVTFIKLFSDVSKITRTVDNRSLEQWLKISLVIQLILAIPVVTSEGYGIFSDDSRIAYLDNSSIFKYYTYAGFFISAIQAGLLAMKLSAGRMPGIVFYTIIISNLVLSTISGSKGGIFLWIVSILTLVNYRYLRVRWTLIVLLIIIFSIALTLTGMIISDTLGITGLEFIDLTMSRFFLNNDARAITLELRGTTGQISDLIYSSFRGISAKLGFTPADPPLGILLFDRYFGIYNGTGSNASLIALITYYSMRGYALFPALVACLALGTLYGTIVGARRILHGSLRKMAVTLIGMMLVQQLSQDFLTFQLLVPLACIAWFILYITDGKYPNASSQRNK